MRKLLYPFNNTDHECPVEKGVWREQCLFHLKPNGHDAQRVNDDGKDATNPYECCQMGFAKIGGISVTNLFPAADHWRLPGKASRGLWLSVHGGKENVQFTNSYQNCEFKEFWEHPKPINIELHFRFIFVGL